VYFYYPFLQIFQVPDPDLKSKPEYKTAVPSKLYFSLDKQKNMLHVSIKKI